MGKIVLWSPSIGDVVFPMTPTSIDGMAIGQTTPAAGKFSNVIVTGSVAVTGGIAIGGIRQDSVANGIAVAATTNLFTSAVALTAQINVVGTVAVGASTAAPVGLPTVASILGAPITVFNNSTRTVAVWPKAADKIDALAAGSAVLLDAGLRVNFYPVGATQWLSAQMGVTSV